MIYNYGNCYAVNGELYHHGVKGMKWGVRKQREPSTPRQFKRALNRTDWSKTSAKYRYNTHKKQADRRADRMMKDLHKRADKANKLLNEKNNVKKSLKVAVKAAKKTEKYNKVLARDRAIDRKNLTRYQTRSREVNSLVKKAVAKGYNVNAKGCSRLVDVKVIPIGTTIYIQTTHAPGTKYKVAAPKVDKK